MRSAPGLVLISLTMVAATAETVRLQVAGEWCFIKTPVQRSRPGEAVILIHGNGQTVDERSSSWEQNRATQRLMNALLEAGYLLAQSNHGATPQNGMWGNPKTQTAVLGLMNRLRERYAIKRFHAIAISAGNVTLLNLVLDRNAAFETAVLVVPVVS